MRKIIVGLLLSIGVILSLHLNKVNAQTVCNVGNTTGNDTAKIQNAISSCASGGEARLTSGNIYTSGQINLASGVTLNLNGATLVASPNAGDYTPYGPKGRLRFIVGSGVSNISIIGPGTIRVTDGDTTGASMIDFGAPSGVSGITLRNFTIDTRMAASQPRNSHLGIGRSVNVTVENVSIFGKRDSGSGGNDGINIFASQNVRVSGCHINTDDVALTFGAEPGNPDADIVVENCRLSSARTGMTFGTQGDHYLQNITLRNIEIYDTGEKYGNRGVKFEMFFGGLLENITLANFTFNNVGTRLGCSVGQLRYPDDVVGKCVDEQSTVRNFCMQGFSASDVDFIRQNLISSVSTSCGGSGPPPLSLTPTSMPPASIPGDLAKDGDVDIFDYNLLVENFGKTNCGNIADIDANCKVDLFDYNILVENFGKTQ